MSAQWKYPTAFSSWGDEERAAIDRVATSGQFTIGWEVTGFEQEFAAFHGKRHAIMVNSGSSANLIMVAALAHLGYVKRDDKVVVPALAWSTTYAPLVQHGLELVLADCDETWNANPNESQVPWDTKLIVGCSILGNPSDLNGWGRAIASAEDAVLIEDNCESLGARLGNKLCGTFGLMSSSSLYWSHQISAIEGGVILTDDASCAHTCRVLRAHGWTRDVLPPGSASFEREYDFVAMGYNVRPLEMHAAIARAQLKKLPSIIGGRLANQAYFESKVRELELPITLPTKNGGQSPFGLHFTMDPACRLALVHALRQGGVDCRLPTGGSFRLHPYATRWSHQQTPRADNVHRSGMFLGCAPHDIRELIDHAANIMRRTL